MESTANRWLHYYATFVAFSTFLLLVAGALVTSNDAGLSVPDWPTSFRSFRITPPTGWVGGVKFEHGHRLIAGAVVLLTIGLALWLWRAERRPWVRRLGGLAVLAIVLQAVLGGITVLFYLPVDISVAHACLAQLFFCITVSLALFTSPGWRWDEPKIEDASAPSLREMATLTTALVFVQLMLGAAFRHHGFGIVPHVVVAALVSAGVLWILVRVLTVRPRSPSLPSDPSADGLRDAERGRSVSEVEGRNYRGARALERSALVLAGLLVVQVFLGFASYMILVENPAMRDQQPLPSFVEIATTHVVVGALLLAASLVLTYRAFQFTSPGQCEVAMPANTSFPRGSTSLTALSDQSKGRRESTEPVSRHQKAAV